MGGKKAKFAKHKKWMGKGDKWLEKLNILGYEKPSAWWVEVRGIPPFARYAKDGAPGTRLATTRSSR